MESEIKLVKLSLYPADEPTSYAVGFSVTCNGRSKYADCTVPLADCTDKTDEEIANLGWEQLGAGFESFITASEAKSALIGQAFVPSAEAKAAVAASASKTVEEPAPEITE